MFSVGVAAITPLLKFHHKIPEDSASRKIARNANVAVFMLINNPDEDPPNLWESYFDRVGLGIVVSLDNEIQPLFIFADFNDAVDNHAVSVLIGDDVSKLDVVR